MRVVVTGTSGLIGTTLVRALSASGNEVLRLVRGPPDGPDQATWDSTAHRLDPELLRGADAVINLAGPGIGDRRWTEARRREVRQARLDVTGTVAAAIAAATTPPPVLLTASAIGWYGHTGDVAVDESAEHGSGFLADLCADWEQAAAPAAEVGTRVTWLRSGVVLAGTGGVLARLAPFFRLGVGGRLGSGRQYWSWISLADEVAAIGWLLENDLAGPVNLTAPTPVTNAEFTRVLGEVMHRPAVVPVPALALRLAVGGFAEESILNGQRVLPERLTGAGFEFRYSELRAALAWALR